MLERLRKEVRRLFNRTSASLLVEPENGRAIIGITHAGSYDPLQIHFRKYIGLKREFESFNTLYLDHFIVEKY